MKEWKSQLETIMPAEELRFPPTSGFRPFNKYFTPESVAHPAKANNLLLYYLIKKFTKEGETVLDPMAGTGSTGVVANLLGRNAVLVDLEEKFCRWMRENVKLAKEKGTKGKSAVIQGDARKLSELLKEADVVITSPPHSGAISKQGGPTGVKRVGVSTITAREYSASEENIGNLPHGEIDTIITSPPYGEVRESCGIAKRGYRGSKHSPTDLVGKRSYMPDKFESEENISRLPFGSVDAVITSPPYSEQKRQPSNINLEHEVLSMETDTRPDTKFRRTPGRMRAIKAMLSGYGEDRENIGNLAHGQIDAVITSPPYEGSLEGSSRHTRGGIASRDRKLAQTGTYADVVLTSPPYGHDSVVHKNERRTQIAKEKFGYSDFYSPSGENIGNLKKETYLEAMLRVYRECWKMLKPNGKAIIIIKSFIRNKKVVDLPWHTYLLLRKCGFVLEKLFKLRLEQQSFWRILYYQKHPSVPQVQHEHILVFKKV